MNGIIVINKEKGYTSKDVTSIIRKLFNTSKVGHAGTLDPLATGVLVVALGTCLKVLEYLTDEDKEYIVTVGMGFLTDTLDLEGKLIKEDYDYKVDKEKLIEVLKSFKGISKQEVPIYSAIRVDGKKLYHYARNNEEVELPVREIEIKDIELLSFNSKEFKFRVVVSKGTYIRSLVRDIGEKLGIYCTMTDLERTRQGEFTIEASSTLDDLKDNNYKLFSIEKALTNFLIVEVDDYLENRILNGSILENRYNEEMVVFKNKLDDILGIYKIYDKDPSRIKPIKILK